MLYDADVDVKTAQYIMGHKSIHVTMDIYTKLSHNKLTASIDKLNNHLSSSQNVVSASE
jgi:integrase